MIAPHGQPCTIYKQRAIETNNRKTSQTTVTTLNQRSCPKQLSYPNNYDGNISITRHHIRVQDIENSSNAFVTMWGKNHDGSYLAQLSNLRSLFRRLGRAWTAEEIILAQAEYCSQNCTLPRRPTLRAVGGGRIAQQVSRFYTVLIEQESISPLKDSLMYTRINFP